MRLKPGKSAHGRYDGPINALQGHTAIVRRNADGRYLVQFDKQPVGLNTDWNLTFGWHEFSGSNFKRVK